MRWSILIATVPARSNLLCRLLYVLYPQLTDDIELVVDGRDITPIGKKRQRMVESSSGEYLSFIDDDDLVAEDYVKTLLPLMDGVDYVGFKLQYYANGVADKPTFHDLKYDTWSEDHNGYYRGVTHLNPIRSDIAKQVKFSGGFGEDKRWADSVQKLCHSSNYTPRTMYHYYFFTGNTLTQGDKHG